MPLSLIELEFTESAAMEVSATVLDEIAALRNDGARITIDDFGTGYSNLAGFAPCRSTGSSSTRR